LVHRNVGRFVADADQRHVVDVLSLDDVVGFHNVLMRRRFKRGVTHDIEVEVTLDRPIDVAPDFKPNSLALRICADECKRLAIRNPFTGPFVDLGYQFSLLYDCHSVGLARAVETLGMTFEGAPHDALHDARNTAHVHLEMVRRTRLIVPPLIEVKRSA
jgi:hypothetical protein